MPSAWSMAMGSTAPWTDHEKNVCSRDEADDLGARHRGVVFDGHGRLPLDDQCAPGRLSQMRMGPSRPAPVARSRNDYDSAPVTAPSLWRHADFMKLWAGQTVSELGSVVTRTAVPLVALLVLGAGPLEMALLVVAGASPCCSSGFFAGAWVDRLRRRPLLIGADAIRAVVLFSIPVAYVAGVLRMEQLYLVVFLEGCLGALFDAAYPAYVPSLIGVDRVVEGNSKLATSSSIAEIGGPGLAGGLVQLIGAPFAILVDAVSFVVSAVSLVLIRGPEPPRPPRTVTTPIREEIVEGLRLVRRHPILVPLTLRSVVAHMAGAFYGVLYTIYLIDELHLSPFLLGIVISAGGVGSLVGSFFAVAGHRAGSGSGPPSSGPRSAHRSWAS